MTGATLVRVVSAGARSGSEAPHGSGHRLALSAVWVEHCLALKTFARRDLPDDRDQGLEDCLGCSRRVHTRSGTGNRTPRTCCAGRSRQRCGHGLEDWIA